MTEKYPLIRAIDAAMHNMDDPGVDYALGCEIADLLAERDKYRAALERFADPQNYRYKTNRQLISVEQLVYEAAQALAEKEPG